MTVYLPAALALRLTDMARATPAVEVCALLGGNGNHLQQVYPVINVAADPAREYWVDAQDQIAAMRRMRAAGETLRGIFHSHPASEPVPSATDRDRAAYPGVYYLILSLATDVPQLRAFYFDGRDFLPVNVESA